MQKGNSKLGVYNSEKGERGIMTLQVCQLSDKYMQLVSDAVKHELHRQVADCLVYLHLVAQHIFTLCFNASL